MKTLLRMFLKEKLTIQLNPRNTQEKQGRQKNSRETVSMQTHPARLHRQEPRLGTVIFPEQALQEAAPLTRGATETGSRPAAVRTAGRILIRILTARSIRNTKRTKKAARQPESPALQRRRFCSEPLQAVRW